MQMITTRCAIAGGGPAGMMLGFLLARAGIDVVVLEKHADFNRDFRGDTIHPSTLELMHELRLLEEFLKLPHQEVQELRMNINGHIVPLADFSHLPVQCPFIAFMPQWDFLNFLATQAKKFSGFRLLMRSEVSDMIIEDERVVGLRAKVNAVPGGVEESSTNGELAVRADLVIGADGRHSRVRSLAKLEVIESGVPIDVLWMRISKRPDDPGQSLGFFQGGKLQVLLDRGDYWQCGHIIPKGKLEFLKSRGLEKFHEDIADMSPFLRNRLGELDDWSKIKLLTVQINRLRKWHRQGLLCIGDAAHAMSPAGGVGINLAIQDAVATANLLSEALRSGAVPESRLRSVQERREWPTRIIQLMQVFIHRQIVTGQASPPSSKLPLVARLFRDLPVLRRLPARFVGLGPRPEHVAARAATLKR